MSETSEEFRWKAQHVPHGRLHPESAWVQQKRPSWAAPYFRCCTGETLAASELVAPRFQTIPIRRYSARQLRPAWARTVALIRQGLIDDQLHFYLHFPFCTKRCRYCNLVSRPPAGKEEIEGFVRRAQKQFRYFQETFSGMRFRSLSFGGGTPSLLSASQIQRLMAEFHLCFEMRPDAYMTTEFNPISTTEDKVRAARDAGFTRISLGVQTLDPVLLRSVDRGYQTEESVARAIGILKRAGFRNGFNADLLAGLEGQEPRDILSSFERLASWGVPTIAIQMLAPTAAYGESLRPNLGRFTQRLLEELPPLALKMGYEYMPMFDEIKPRGVLDLGYGRRDAPAAFKLDSGAATGHEEALSPFTYGSVFAMGHMALSTISGAAFYRETPQMSADFDPAAPIYEGSALDRESRTLWHALSRIDGVRQVSAHDLERGLGRRARTFLAPFLASLRKAGRIRIARGRMASRQNGEDRLPCICTVKSPWARTFVKKNMDFRHQVPLGERDQPWVVGIENVRPKRRYLFRLGELGFSISRGDGEALPTIVAELPKRIRRLFRASAKTIPETCTASRASFIVRGLKKESPRIAAESRKAARIKKAISTLEEALRTAPPDWPRRKQIKKALQELRP